MNWPSVSIVVRTLNEKERLKNLLNNLNEQKYDGKKEIIVVDNESVDGTAETAKKFGAEVVIIPRDEFTFPKSLNVGATEANNEILVFTVGHALPVSSQWLKSGIRHFADKKVGGVFSPVIPHKFPGYPKRTLAEIRFYYPGYIMAVIKGFHPVKFRGMGVFGATNCAVRKDLWLKHHFDERFELGGDDGEMAKWLREQGYKIICDWRFAVYHSHGLGFRGLKEQFNYWSKLGGPTTFSRDEFVFREDLDFSTK